MSRKPLIILLLFLCCVLLSRCNAMGLLPSADKYFTGINHLDSDDDLEINTCIQRYLPNYNYINAALVHDGEIILTRTYGANRLDLRDVYASVSKPVTAMIFLQLLEQGIIDSIDDPIELYSSRYAGSMPAEYADTPITFMHLLTHQSGIPHEGRIWQDGALHLLFKPGTEVSYSTKAFRVLGEVLQEITGKSFNRLVQENIGEPVGAASFRADSVILDSPGGRVYSTIEDMARFAIGATDETYVTNELLYGTALKHYAEDASGEICLGWYGTNLDNDDLAAYHAGSNGRPRAFIAVKPIRKMAVALTGRNRSEQGSHDFGQLTIELMEILNTLEE